MNYKPPLRSAVVFLLELKAGLVSVETIAEIAEVHVDRARAFMSSLSANKIVTELDTRYKPGPGWQEWAGRSVRTRPKIQTDFDCIQEMQQIKNRFRHNVEEELMKRGWRQAELARRAGIGHQYVVRLITRNMPPPLPQSMLIAKVLGKRLEDLTA